MQLSRSFSLLLASSGTRRPAIFSIRSSWWRTKKSFGSGDGFVNKLDGASFCSSLARPGRHGGGRRADLPGSEAPWEDGEAASAFLPRSSSPAVPTWLLPSSRCIHWPFERLLHKLVLTTVSRLGFLFLPADMPKGRIFGPGMASHACLVPSGVVPGDDAGGHARISQRKDGGEGLDCNLYLPLWVLEFCRKAKLLDDASILSSCKFRLLFTFCSSANLIMQPGKFFVSDDHCTKTVAH